MCVLDRHSVKGPGVAATHHVPAAWRIGFWLQLTLVVLAEFEFTVRSFPMFLLSGRV